MASVRHPNVISYLGVCAEPACIVTEYCSKGSLTDVLRRGRASVAHRTALDWPRRLNMAMDAAKVASARHHTGITCNVSTVFCHRIVASD